MLFHDVVFWLLTAVAVGSALGVVLIRDLFRAALLLVAVFVAVGGYFVLLSAEFLAVVQVLIYAGAISVLIIFAVMLTRDVQRGNAPNRLQIPAAMLAALLLTALTAAAIDTQWNFLPENQRQGIDLVQTAAVANVPPETLEQAATAGPEAAEYLSAPGAGFADLLTGKFVLPFEAVSALLLAALIGALALVRPRPVPTRTASPPSAAAPPPSAAAPEPPSPAPAAGDG